MGFCFLLHTLFHKCTTSMQSISLHAENIGGATTPSNVFSQIKHIINTHVNVWQNEASFCYLSMCIQMSTQMMYNWLFGSFQSTKGDKFLQQNFSQSTWPTIFISLHYPPFLNINIICLSPFFLALSSWKGSVKCLMHTQFSTGLSDIQVQWERESKSLWYPHY